MSSSYADYCWDMSQPYGYDECGYNGGFQSRYLPKGYIEVPSFANLVDYSEKSYKVIVSASFKDALGSEIKVNTFFFFPKSLVKTHNMNKQALFVNEKIFIKNMQLSWQK